MVQSVILGDFLKYISKNIFRMILFFRSRFYCSVCVKLTLCIHVWIRFSDPECLIVMVVYLIRTVNICSGWGQINEGVAT